MKTNNPLLNETWYEQIQIRKLIWESEARFWKIIQDIKGYAKSKPRYVHTHRWN